VSQLLKLAQFPERYHMTQVYIRETGIKTFFKAQLSARAQVLNHLFFHDDFSHSTFQ
jgi:hypothetical protein